MNEIPTVSFPRLWHVGTLDLSHKRPGSLEGACLSVSRCPGAWREISDGHVSGPCWVADASDIPLLDAHALDDAQRRDVLAWGVAEGLCEPAVLWRMETFDEEMDDTRIMILETRDEAICELCLDEEDPDYEDQVNEQVSRIDEHRGTPRLADISLHPGRDLLGDSIVLDMLLPLWTWAKTDLAGVWWDDRFDPLAYSAPRGGILPARMDRLRFAPAPFEPYDEDEASEDDEEDEDES